MVHLQEESKQIMHGGRHWIIRSLYRECPKTDTVRTTLEETSRGPDCIGPSKELAKQTSEIAYK